MRMREGERGSEKGREGVREVESVSEIGRYG